MKQVEEFFVIQKRPDAGDFINRAGFYVGLSIPSIRHNVSSTPGTMEVTVDPLLLPWLEFGPVRSTQNPVEDAEHRDAPMAKGGVAVGLRYHGVRSMQVGTG
jgi:hypothetical protein